MASGSKPTVRELMAATEERRQRWDVPSHTTTEFRWAPDPDALSYPGLDRAAPPREQLEQMQQLITRHLQNVDANMSRANELIANKMLPAIKKMAIAMDPAVQAADWWLAFYEKAANIRVPTEFEEYEYQDAEEQEEEPEAEEYDEQAEEDSILDASQAEADATDGDISASAGSDQSIARDVSVLDHTPESSFMPGAAAVSSTPARPGGGREEGDDTASTDDGSAWLGDADSVMGRLTREMDILLSMDAPAPPSAAPTPRAPSSSPRKGKSKARVPGSPLLRNVLRQSLRPAPAGSPAPPARALHDVLKKNPFLPPDSPSKRWNGVVDVRALPQPDFSIAGAGAIDEDDTARLSMPPPPRATRAVDSVGAGASGAAAKLVQTPRKQAAARITAELLRSVADSKRKPPPARAGTALPVRIAPAGRAAGASVPAAGGGRAHDESGSTLPSPDLGMWGRRVLGRPNARAGGEVSSSIGTPPSLVRYTPAYKRTASANAAAAGSATPLAWADDDSPMPTPPSVTRYTTLLAQLDRGETPDYAALGGGGGRSPSPTPGRGHAPAPDVADDDETIELPDIQRHLHAAAAYPDEDTYELPAPTPPPFAAHYTPGAGYDEVADDPTDTFAAPVRAAAYYPSPATAVAHMSASTAPSTASRASGSVSSFGAMLRTAGLDAHGFGDLSSASTDPGAPAPGPAAYASSDGDGSFDDSFGASPTPAPLHAVSAADDSFGSADSSDSSFGDPAPAPGTYAVPGDSDPFDDSFEDDLGVGEEETVFGLRPGQRGALQMHGGGALQDTRQYNAVLGGLEPATPTPWMQGEGQGR